MALKPWTGFALALLTCGLVIVLPDRWLLGGLLVMLILALGLVLFVAFGKVER